MNYSNEMAYYWKCPYYFQLVTLVIWRASGFMFNAHNSSDWCSGGNVHRKICKTNSTQQLTIHLSKPSQNSCKCAQTPGKKECKYISPVFRNFCFQGQILHWWKQAILLCLSSREHTVQYFDISNQSLTKGLDRHFKKRAEKSCIILSTLQQLFFRFGSKCI